MPWARLAEVSVGLQGAPSASGFIANLAWCWGTQLRLGKPNREIMFSFLDQFGDGVE